jgi:nitrite reductase (NADH) large subunit
MKNLIIIGNGMVGYKFCERFLSKPSSGNYKITVFGEEPRPAYDRVHLSEYFSARSEEKLRMAPLSWYEENGIELVLRTPIVRVDPELRKVYTHDGLEYPYDKLVFATGSSAFVPPIKGFERDGVFVYRTIEDLEMIMDYAPKVKRAAVIGGGLLGLEAAKALLDMKLEAHVVEFAPRLMPRQLDGEAAEILKDKIEQLGVSIHLSKITDEIAGNGKVEGMQFRDGEFLPVEMVVISAGIRPRDEVAKKSGLQTGERGGIVVDDYMQTSHKDIYAIGECALYNHMIYGLVAPGYEMADAAIAHICGEEKQFKGADMSTKLKLIGVDVASFGDALGETEGSRSIVFTDQAKGIYKRVNIDKKGKKLLGGILLGDVAQYNMLLQTTLLGMAIPPEPEDLILGSRKGGAQEGQGLMDLPDAAIVCSCEGVTKGALCGAIEEHGISDLGELKKCTKAGTGCGGCLPMVKDLMTESLKKQGKVVKKVLCEHFDYSRQELFDLIKVGGIKNFNDLLDKHGKGDGCEICKPVAASIFASIWNEMILKDSQTIQDTNDRFLANIQRNGTYSVVPRMPGGEVTPEKLIVIGQVAKKYGLYCKVTGGQRIDMFGAHVGDLPDIWEELIEAGFESGHAYAKSLRTVKSCVGSSWCRYGVQDSVGFAIRVEERYRGLRSPHKLKSAVSGCIRECAEARSKDFGIIATEKGWNLYVCGNGGAKPTHAFLLASDIDDETCIKYIDRFLMFYIKTADPLMRTSVWLSKLDGGEDYVRDVVVNDSLGLAAQLEKEMEFMVETYACEWKEVVNNPELRRRFSHFVNTDEKDKSVQFEEVRGQIAPVAWNK